MLIYLVHHSYQKVTKNLNTDNYFSKALKINFKTKPHPPRFVCLKRYFFYFLEFYWLQDVQAKENIDCSWMNFWYSYKKTN